MKRLGMHQLDTASAADGDVPTYDGATDRFVPAPQAGGGTATALDDLTDVDTSTTAPADGQVLAFDATSGLWLPADATGGGGGASTLDQLTDVDTSTTPPTAGQVLLYDATAALWKPGTVSGGSGGGGGALLIDNAASVPAGTAAGTVIFEKSPPGTVYSFEGLAALPAGWSRRGVASETFDPAGMGFAVTAGEGYELAVADLATQFTLELGLLTADNNGKAQGIIVTAAATGDGVSAGWYNNPNGALMMNVNSSYQYGGSFQTASGVKTDPSRLRLRRDGSSWYASYSLDGQTWSGESPGLGVVFTPGRIGFGSVLGGSGSMKVSYLKYTAGGGRPGGLRGWWDGSKIVPF